MPVPEVDSLDELNRRLARETAAEERKHRARQTDTVGQRFAAERPCSFHANRRFISDICVYSSLSTRSVR